MSHPLNLLQPIEELVYGSHRAGSDLAVDPLIIKRAIDCAKLVYTKRNYYIDGTECQCNGYEQKLLGYEKGKLLLRPKGYYNTHCCGPCERVYILPTKPSTDRMATVRTIHYDNGQRINETDESMSLDEAIIKVEQSDPTHMTVYNFVNGNKMIDTSYYNPNNELQWRCMLESTHLPPRYWYKEVKVVIR